jgi:membrane protease YdiL (CAAX protease family)
LKPWADFSLRVAAAFVAALALSPALGVVLPETPFHRVMTRTFQLALVVALVVRRGPLREWPAKLRAMGFRGPERRRRALLGASVGAGALVLVLLASWLLGGRELAGPHRVPFWKDLGEAVLTAVFVSLFEEILFRGYVKGALGHWASAAFFSAVHFVQPIGRTAPAGAGYDPLLAVKRLPEVFEAWTEPRRATLGFLCLLVLGLALNRLRDRTGTLYLGMGVHAGAVFVIQIYRRVLEGNPTVPEDATPFLGTPVPVWIHGDALMRGGGVLPLLALLLLLLASYRAPLPPWARA